MELSSEARSILLKMKGELSKGWIKGELSNDDGICLYGGLILAAGMQPIPCVPGGPGAYGRTNPEATEQFSIPCISCCDSPYGREPDITDPIGEVVSALCAASGETWDTLSRWNDAPERTHAEIIALIDKTLGLEELETISVEVKEAIPVASG